MRYSYLLFIYGSFFGLKNALYRFVLGFGGGMLWNDNWEIVQYPRSDYKNLLSFMGQYKLDTGILVTRDLFDMYEANGKYIQLIPAWLFLMMVS